MPFFYISAAHKSSGKTTLSVGIAAAFAKQGLRVQTFKKGPDYIDPLWLEKASGSSCYNLDFNTMSDAEISKTFEVHETLSDICLIEGNKGLYDGVDLDGKDSNAAMAKLLGAPVILVLDCAGITRGIAPLLLGYQKFDPEINIAGVILNKVANRRHDQKLRAVIDKFVKIPVLGSVMRDNTLFTSERHLGLIPPEETGSISARLDQLADLVASSIDLEALRKVAEHVPSQRSQDVKSTLTPSTRSNASLRIGVIRDAAFGFYYADDLETFEKQGAELVFINGLQDDVLPDLDGLFIGGGFPETHLPALEKNKGLRASIYQAGKAGLPIYAECGGLMYLSRSIEWQGDKAEMVGLIPGDILMHEKPQGRGLVRLKTCKNGLWNTQISAKSVGNNNEVKQLETSIFKAHEFHYASLEGLPSDSHFAYEVQRGHGITGQYDGIIVGNLQANFSHLRHNDQKQWITEFLSFVKKVKSA